MSISKTYTCYAVMLAGGGTMIDQITDQKIDPKVEEIVARANGQVDPRFVALMSQAPLLSFTTSAIATALGVCGPSGLAIGAAADWYLQKNQDGGTRASGANHLKITASKGILIPKTLKASQGKEATIEYDLYCTSSDGTTAPIAVATGQALAGSPTVDELFTVGALVVNGVTYGSVQDITVDFGLKVECKGGDGQAYPTFCCIMERLPSITVKLLDASIFSSLGVGGVAIGSTTSVSFLGITEGGIRSGTNKVISVAEGRVRVDDISGGDEQAASVKITPTYNGSTGIIVVA